MAVTLIAETLAAETGAELEQARRLLAVATETVEKYAPVAPETLQNEAVIRYVGYLSGSDYGGVKSESVGPRSVEYTPPSNNGAAFRNSGAAALLTHYKRRRAGAL